MNSVNVAGMERKTRNGERERENRETEKTRIGERIFLSSHKIALLGLES